MCGEARQESGKYVVAVADSVPGWWWSPTVMECVTPKK